MKSNVKISGSLLLGLAVLVAGCGGGGGGSGGGSAKVTTSAVVLGYSFPNGSEVVVGVKVKDKKSRDVELSFEFSLDGGTTWKAATTALGKKAVVGSPEGREYAFTWNAFADLGTSYWPGALLRVTPVVPAGTAGIGDPIEELFTYEVVMASDLYPLLLEDMGVNGMLDTFTLLDLRGATDYATSHLPGALFLAFADIQDRGIDALPFPLGERLVFYCYGGG